MERKTRFRQAKIRQKVPQTARQEVSSAAGTTAYSCSVPAACPSSQPSRLGVTCSRVAYECATSTGWRRVTFVDPRLHFVTEVRIQGGFSSREESATRDPRTGFTFHIPTARGTAFPIYPSPGAHLCASSPFMHSRSLLAPLEFFTRHLARAPRLTPVQSVSSELRR